ncbi:esterase B1-like [Uranotaenia lowii]|uniref:esterase B1-like n=1 Tax=Uranotaenia lowii TaxID=190385 RepID=UPI00247B0379|nr:esterase B1-like [Uranotaenia lowii]
MVMRSTARSQPSGDRNARVIVQVTQGHICGATDVLPNGDPYYFFKGVPYAQPPIDELRFRSPVPIDRYPVSYMDCTKERNNCLGMDVITREITGDEDGLYLNIYTPKVNRKDGTADLPVIVFFHGGGLVGGHADSSMYLPNYLVQEGVVVVTVNYRLGVLGFLYLPEVGLEGNAGLKDQRMALQWVHQNIARFSGDPKNVTLFGASSGGVAGHYHCLSKESKKYFQKAILTSGSVFIDYAHQESPEEKARQLARLLGHDPKTDEEVFKVLCKAPADKLFRLQFQVLTKREKTFEKLFQIPFLPVIEREQSCDAIITKHPIELMSEPNGIGIPILTGYNNREGIMVLIDAVKHLDLYNKEPKRFIPRTLNLDYNSEEARELGKEIKKFYFQDKPVCQETVPQLVDLFTDKYLVAYPIITEMWARFQHNYKLFIYRFSFDGTLNKGKTLIPVAPLKGAAHIDEIYYLFSSPILKTEIPETDPAYQMRQKMVRLFTNFAKHGDPTPSTVDDPLIDFKWTPVENVPKNGAGLKMDLLSIKDNTHVGMEPMPERGRMQFWEKLFQKYNGHIANIKIPTLPLDMNNNI